MAFIEKENKHLQQYKYARKFTASARAAMTHILQSSKIVDSRGILLPSYIGLSQIEGSGVFDPVRTSAIGYDFYMVDRWLRPDLNALEAQLCSGHFQLVFLIHYFGVPQVDVEKFVEMCHRYNVKVIEDCAHTLMGGLEGRRLGSFGDFAIFSVHKSTAAVDGGFFYDHQGAFDEFELTEPLLISAETLTEFVNTDIEAVSRHRLRNYQTVQRWVRSIPQLILMFDTIPDNAVPLNCPVIVESGKREQLYFSMIESGVLPTALYHTLIPEIAVERFPEAHFVSANILNLPTHADISDADLPRYEKALRDAVNEVFSK